MNVTRKIAAATNAARSSAGIASTELAAGRPLHAFHMSIPDTGI